jgi:hypothetical protein
VSPLQIFDMVNFFEGFAMTGSCFTEPLERLLSPLSSILPKSLIPFFRESWLKDETVRFMILPGEMALSLFLNKPLVRGSFWCV